MLMHMHSFATAAEMGRELGGISRSAMNRYLKGERTVGLDFVLRVHRELHVSLDWLVDRDPPQEWFDPDYSGPLGKPRK
jgi:transcriptional regulator with XRE-family HTH domain